MNVRLSDGYSLFIEDLGGDGIPLVVLHGGPGLDHTHLRPWLDPLNDVARVIYVDERGQGRSERVDPATLSLEVFARDVDLLAEALGLERFALLGHSFGAIITTWHAVNLGHGRRLRDLRRRRLERGADGRRRGVAGRHGGGGQGDRRLLGVGEDRRDARGLRRADAHPDAVPLPRPAAGGLRRGTVYVADVLRHFANEGYGDFDYTPDLGNVSKPTLVLVGAQDRTTTPRAARVLHSGIPGSELVELDGAGHMSMIEAQEPYLAAVKRFLASLG